MTKKLYPLNVGQMLQYLPIKETGTQRCCNISIFSGLQTEIKFGLLKQCIEEEIKRADCLRLRFTAPDKDGNVMQYIAPNDPRDIPFIDLSGKSMEEADAFLQQKTFEEFNDPDIPMVEFTMVKMPEGYNGMYVHIDHRLTDSSGLIVMINDIMELYCHYRFGSRYPDPLTSFEEVLQTDLEKAGNEKRRAKDEKFWRDYLTENGEPIYSDIKGPKILQESRKRHKDKSLRAADVELKDRSVGVADFHLEPGPTQGLLDFCATQGVSMTNLILLAMRTYLSKCNGGQEDITLRNFVSRRSTHAEWTCGGSRVLSFPCRTIITPDTEFLDALYEVQNIQNRVYMHCNFDPVEVDRMLKEIYGAPDNTEYISMSLTYQPMPVRMQNEHLKGINVRSVWYPNGAATKRIYLTVTHSSNDGGMIFDYHYQKAVLSYEDMQTLYYYMMKIMFRGIEEPDLTIGELINTL
ncbi:MAG: chromosome condensation protein [Lachnospiraceae bacterium]|nr:chromosome condensation protein [Lachnospiraceae bacterium]MBR1524089.1 chromosome condensation protein [Lachnospiraceae bacterium]